MSSSQIPTILPFLFTAISKSHPNLPLFDVSAQNKHKKTLLTFYDNKSNGRKTSEWIMKLMPRLLNPTANNVPVTNYRWRCKIEEKEKVVWETKKVSFGRGKVNFERRKKWILRKKRKFWKKKRVNFKEKTKISR